MAKIKKIVFFIEEHFNQRDYERFGIDILTKNGFDVEVWDFTAFLATEGYKKTRPPDKKDWEKCIVFQDKKDALSGISRLDSTYFVISFIHFTHKTLSLYRMLKKKEIPYGIFLFALLMNRTFAGTTNDFWRRLKKVPKQPLRIIDFAIKKWLINILLLVWARPADIIFAQAEKYLMPNGFPANSKSEVLFVHSFDYDIYLKQKDVSVLVDENLGVFLDEYVPFHPDYVFTGDKPRVTAEQYYPKLRDFFDYLESTYNVKIVIAAHPRSHYESHPGYFDGRPVIRGKTVELVKKSGFVLLHNSTALNYAVLFKKPMIFFTTDGVNKSLVDPPSIECLAEYFNKKSHNLDEANSKNIDFEKELRVDDERYNAYKNEYIKMDSSEERPFWQIVANRIAQWGEKRC
jgi:hypothetical protein